LIKGLKRAEQQLEKQLAGIRSAIASLEFGGAVSPGLPAGRRGPGRPQRSGGTPRRTISARGRKAISDAQKARWVRQKAQEKRK
jgi:hypothetical protein